MNVVSNTSSRLFFCGTELVFVLVWVDSKTPVNIQDECWHFLLKFLTTILLDLLSQQVQRDIHCFLDACSDWLGFPLVHSSSFLRNTAFLCLFVCKCSVYQDKELWAHMMMIILLHYSNAQMRGRMFKLENPPPALPTWLVLIHQCNVINFQLWLSLVYMDLISDVL